MAINGTTTYAVGLKKFFVEYLHVTAKGHYLRDYEVEAGSKEEALRICPKMTVTGRVKAEGEILSCLKTVANSIPVSDRGCRVF